MTNSTTSALTLIRLTQGDEIIETLTKLATQSDLSGAHFTAIGACKELILSYYNLQEKKYEDNQFSEDMEITGIIGNIGWMEGKPVIHAHGTFGRKDLSVVGGHVKKLIVSATCEITITLLPQKIERAFDPETGLNLIKDSF